MVECQANANRRKLSTDLRCLRIGRIPKAADLKARGFLKRQRAPADVMRYTVQVELGETADAGHPEGVSQGITSPEYGKPEHRSASQNGAKPPANMPDDGMDEIQF